MKAFVIDVSKCNGCYCCQIACKDENVGNDWTPYAKPTVSNVKTGLGYSIEEPNFNISP